MARPSACGSSSGRCGERADRPRRQSRMAGAPGQQFDRLVEAGKRPRQGRQRHGHALTPAAHFDEPAVVDPQMPPDRARPQPVPAHRARSVKSAR